MNKDGTEIGCEWVRDDCGDRLKFLQGKTHESSIPMKSDGNSKNANDVEEHMMKKLNKKKETTNVWFEQIEENKDDKKTNWCSKKIWILKLKKIGIGIEIKVILVMKKVIEVLKVVKIYSGKVKISEKDKTIKSLQKTVALLEKIDIEMCTKSEKSSGVSEKSKSSLRCIGNKHKGKEKRN